MANTKNVKKTIKLLKAHKSVKFDMGTLFSDEKRPSSNKHPCGTSCCLAGFAFIAAKGRNWTDDENMSDVENVATEFLGLSSTEAHDLFYPGSEIYDHARRRHGIQVLKHLRDTGEVDWDIVDTND